MHPSRFGCKKRSGNRRLYFENRWLRFGPGRHRIRLLPENVRRSFAGKMDGAGSTVRPQVHRKKRRVSNKNGQNLKYSFYEVFYFSWSYGVLLWEIMTLGGKPYPSVPLENLYQLLKQGHRMNQPHNCPNELYFVMMECWQDSPEKRWSFSEIEKYLDDILMSTASEVSGQISCRFCSK